MSRSPKGNLADLFWAFARISVLSVGGGTMAWIRETVVEKKAWLREDEFAHCLAACQLLPGANTINMAVFLGAELGGWTGSLSCLLGLTLLPFFIVLSLGVLYGSMSHDPYLASLFQGLGSGAAGVSLGTGLNMAHKHLRKLDLALIALVAFGAMVAHVPLLLILGLVLLLTLLTRGKS